MAAPKAPWHVPTERLEHLEARRLTDRRWVAGSPRLLATVSGAPCVSSLPWTSSQSLRTLLTCWCREADPARSFARSRRGGEGGENSEFCSQSCQTKMDVVKTVVQIKIFLPVFYLLGCSMGNIQHYNCLRRFTRNVHAKSTTVALSFHAP